MPTSDVELAEAQIAQDVDAVERLDVGVQVADAHAELAVVVGQVLGHALGQRGDRARARSSRRALSDLGEQVVHLARHRAHLDRAGPCRPVGRMICSTTTPSAFWSS